VFTLSGLVLIGLGLVGLADLGPLRGSRPGAGSGVIRGASPGMAIVGGVGLIVIDLILVFIVLGVSSAGAQEGETVPTVEVTVDSRSDDKGGTPAFVDGLAPTTVLRIRADRFPADTTGSLRQCVYGDTRMCANAQPVRFDGSGRADVQFLVEDEAVAPEICGPGGPRCTVEIRAGRDEAVIEVLFGATAPQPGRLDVSPRTGLDQGDRVTVRVTGLPADVALVATVCAAPAQRGDRCGAPAPEIPLVTDASGAAEATMVLDITRVGADGVACGRRTRCQVVVMSDDVTVRAPVVVLDLAGVPGPSYDTGRLIVGLLTAIGLMAVAVVLIRVTDWNPPGEADASAIDDVDFADLDAEAAEFEAAN